jgi:hypothetical protein
METRDVLLKLAATYVEEEINNETPIYGPQSLSLAPDGVRGGNKHHIQGIRPLWQAQMNGEMGGREEGTRSKGKERKNGRKGRKMGNRVEYHNEAHTL